MFYKHWKKIALALTGFFWVNCDSDATSANGEGQSSGDSSDSGKIFSSDSGKIPMSDNERVGQSSSSGVKNNLSSGEMQQPIALYGVPNEVLNCYLNKGDSTVHCGDRMVCKQLTEERWESEYKCIEDICPDYGDAFTPLF